MVILSTIRHFKMKSFQKNSYLIYCFVIAFMIMPWNVNAQAKPAEINNQVQAWVSINSTLRLYKKWGVIADLHMRRTDFLADPSFYFVRAGVNYWIKDNLTISLTYGHMWAAPAKSGWKHYPEENRIAEQIQLSLKIGKVGLVNRLRNEQRWLQKIASDTFVHQYKFTNRVRYLLSINIPVFKNPQYPLLSISDELLVQFGKEIVYNTFDQNRLFLGIKQPISKFLSFDFGYMLVYQKKASGYQYDMNNTLRLFFYYTPDCRKKR